MPDPKPDLDDDATFKLLRERINTLTQQLDELAALYERTRDENRELSKRLEFFTGGQTPSVEYTSLADTLLGAPVMRAVLASLMQAEGL